MCVGPSTGTPRDDQTWDPGDASSLPLNAVDSGTDGNQLLQGLKSNAMPPS